LNLDSIPFFCSIVGGCELKANFGPRSAKFWPSGEKPGHFDIEN
jgi:hypothetical protein